MTSTFDLFLVGLSERINRLWGHYLNLNLQFRPCQPLDRFGVEVMVGLPAHTSWHVLRIGEGFGMGVIDMKILLGAIDRQLGGQGSQPVDIQRAPTILEDALGRKLVEKVLPGMNEIWQGFSPEMEEITLDHQDDLKSPWEPTQSVVETSFSGGWLGCEGVVRFFWPKGIIETTFENLELKRVEVDNWKPLPWGETHARELPFPQQPPPLISQEAEPATLKLEEPKQEKKKRIAFDDFDSMIAALNQS